MGNRIYLSISTDGSDTPAMGPETDKAGQLPCGRKCVCVGGVGWVGKLSAIEIFNIVENQEWTIFLQNTTNKIVCTSQKFK